MTDTPLPCGCTETRCCPEAVELLRKANDAYYAARETHFLDDLWQAFEQARADLERHFAEAAWLS